MKLKEKSYWIDSCVVLSDLGDQLHWHGYHIAIDWGVIVKISEKRIRVIVWEKNSKVRKNIWECEVLALLLHSFSAYWNSEKVEKRKKALRE
jgi:hypothetical protein